MFKYKTGVFVGKFSPPHRGHLNAIISAGTQCETLYVVVSHHQTREQEMYSNTYTKPIRLKQKLKWLSIELANFQHVQVISLDESDIPIYPYDWEQWSHLLRKTVGVNIDAIFGGEPGYADVGYTKYFPETEYVIFDPERTEYPISATEIRNNPYKHWNYILGAAREHFVKKVLITGTESCGKTTLTKMLGKIFFTSWTAEEGRYYSEKYFGGNEDVFELEDFHKICWEQLNADEKAIRTANKVTFFDTDAVVTQFYCEDYVGSQNPRIETFVNPGNYDVVIMLTPDVKWVDDGLRKFGEISVRWERHEKLKQMYESRGFKIIEVGGNYHKRLESTIEIVKSLFPEELLSKN